VAVLFPANLSFVRRNDTAYRIVTQLMDGMVPGSYVVLTHHASDYLVAEHAEMYAVIARLAAQGKTWGLAPRSHAEVSRFFAGLELVEPGVVPMQDWRAGGADRQPPCGAAYAGVARKPVP
jgi:hypothetical protein